MRNERGIALLLAVVTAILLALLGLSLTFSSFNNVVATEDFESHQGALMVADGGMNAAKDALRLSARTLTQSLSALKPLSTSYPAPAANTWEARNPISVAEARNFPDSSRTSLAVAVPGLLASGVPLGKGFYWAKLTDNKEPDDNPLDDTDGKVFLRIVAASPLLGRGLSNGQSQAKNAVAVVEVQLQKVDTFNVTAPMSIVAQNVNVDFSGGSFTVDGYDHTGMSRDDLSKKHDDNKLGLDPYSGISCLYHDESGGGNAKNSVDAITAQIPAKNSDKNIIGSAPLPSVHDNSTEVWGDPESQKLMDPVYLAKFVAQITQIANHDYSTYQHIAGDVIMGTPDHPEINVFEQGLDISGSVTGAGILVVKGDLDLGGALNFDGLILVVGTGNVNMHGTSKGAVLGGMVLANIGPDGKLGTPTLNMKGNANLYYAGDRIRMAFALLAMKVVSWREEVTPEIEPPTGSIER